MQLLGIPPPDLLATASITASITSPALGRRVAGETEDGASAGRSEAEGMEPRGAGAHGESSPDFLQNSEPEAQGSAAH